MDNCSNLSDGVARFLATLSNGDRDKAQQEIYRFARWCGWDKVLNDLKPHEIERYGEQICSQSLDPVKALEPVKALLTFLRKSGLTNSNMSVHLRVRKTAAAKSLSGRQTKEVVLMTAEGYAELQAELRSLEEQRPKVVEEITKAAADKDFRENAPLQAAKEQQGYLEGRIQEIEATLKTVKVAAETNGNRIGIGDTVLISEDGSGDKLQLTLVHATEADPTKGKISMASPMGKALLGHKDGDTVDVAAPAGVLRYKITGVKRDS